MGAGGLAGSLIRLELVRRGFVHGFLVRREVASLTPQSTKWRMLAGRVGGYKPSREQVIVANITSNTAAKVLESGDAIETIDGHPVTGIASVHQLIQAVKPGDTLTMTVKRDNGEKDVKVRTFEATDGTHRTLIGVSLDLHATFETPHVKIGIDPAQVGGPSAGLAFALGVVDRLTPGDLTGGKTVAVTGTIDGLGNVGPIGGIQQKIAGAKDNGATVFLAPASECPDARAAAPSSMTVVKVTTLSGALEALKAITSGSSSYPRC